VIIFQKGSSEPIRGYLVSQNGSQVKVKIPLPGQAPQEPNHSTARRLRHDRGGRSTAMATLRPRNRTTIGITRGTGRETPKTPMHASRHPLYLHRRLPEPAGVRRQSLLGMTALARSARRRAEMPRQWPISRPQNTIRPCWRNSDARGPQRELHGRGAPISCRRCLRMVRNRRSGGAQHNQPPADAAAAPAAFPWSLRRN